MTMNNIITLLRDTVLTMAGRVKGIVCRSTKGRSLETDSVRLGGSLSEVLEEPRGFTSLQTTADMEMQVFAKGHEYSRFGVLIVGKTGTGKSCLINNIFAEDVAKEGHTLKSETKDIVKHPGEVRGSDVIVYDTQGLEDTELVGDGGILEEIKGLIDSHQIHLTVFCISMKVARFDQKRTFVEFNKIGLKWESTIIVLTFADKFHEPPKLKMSREQYFREKVEEWRSEIQDHLKKDVGLPASVADRIAVYPATYDYNVPLPSNEDWFSPLCLGILKALPRNGVLQFMRMHQENFAKEQEEQDVGLQEGEVQRLPNWQVQDQQPQDQRPQDQRPQDQQPQDQRPQDQQPQDQRPQDQRPQDQRPQDQRPQDQQEAGNQPHQRPNIQIDEQTLWDIIKEKFGAAKKQVWRWIQRHILRRQTTNPDEERPDINV